MGYSLCYIYVQDNPNIYDVFIINVGSMVIPSSPVYVHEGGVVFFSMNSKQMSNEIKWISEDPKIVEIDHNGKAIALKEGKTNIMISENIHHLTKVFVFKAKKILLNQAKSPSKITTIAENNYYQDEYQFSFRVVSDEKEINFLNNLGRTEEDPINNNLKFECECKENELFRAKGEIIYDHNQKQQIPKCIISVKKNYGNQSVKILIY